MNRIEIVTVMTALRRLIKTNDTEGALEVVEAALKEAVTKGKIKEYEKKEYDHDETR